MMKTIRSERGQSLVELSISLVVLLWLLAGAVEFGLAYFQFIQLRDAAQEGALYGSVHPIEPGAVAGDLAYDAIVSRVRQQSTSPIDLVNDPGIGIQVSVTGNGCIADTIIVETTYQHRIFMPFATLFTGGNNTITIRARVVDTILNSQTFGC